MNKNTRGILCTLLGGAFWGFSGACGEYLFTNYQVASAWLTTVRMLGAGVVLTAFSLLTKRGRALDVWKVRADAAQLVIFALLGLAFSQYTYLASIDHSNAGTATVLQYLGPVLIMGLVCLKNLRLPTWKEAAAVVLAVGGTFLLATHGNPKTMVLSRQGLTWGLLSAVSLALYTLLPAKIIPKWGSMLITGWAMLLGGIAMALVSRVWTVPVSLDLYGWLAVSGMVVMGTLLAYTMYLQGVADIGGVRASMLASVEPVSATLFSVFWLGTEFMWIDLAGFVCIMATVFLLAKKEK
ncbi:MAG: EamA family transporter [Clostridia bacterium]|nr:EamA family transporter [Clostridia bacterium]